ncbi:MAG: hypothetical protein PHN31_01345 [Candidatus Gracilibacteria bacterium]|nr:hypothetical protein [Candidatus Gracilibacteria bacterium]
MHVNNNIIFTTKIVKTGEKHKIQGIEIISVIDGELFENQKGILKNFESSVYYQGDIEARKDSFICIISLNDNDIILNKVDINKKFGDYCRSNWNSGNNLFPGCGLENTDLYRSEQIEESFSGSKYKFNFRFCGPNTNCGIHNTHNFIEVHTNIAGDGFMQKFDNQSEDSLVETVGLMPGNTHKRFDMDGIYNKNNVPKYPYHRWLGGNSGNIWLAIEKY